MKHSLLIQPQAWQKHLQSGRFKRNSAALKPLVWIFQQMKVQADSENRRR